MFFFLHHFLASAIFLLVLTVAWLVVWFVWLKPWLHRFHALAGILDEIDAVDAKGWARFVLKLKGAKAALLLFVTSMLTGGWGILEALFGVDPSALAPFQNSAPWRGLLADEMAIKAAAIATFASAVLLFRAQVKAAAIVPKVATPAPPAVAPAVAPAG